MSASVLHGRRCAPWSSRQHGFALLELSVALLIATLLLVWSTAALMRQADDAAARAAGTWMLEIRNAAYRMLERHFDTLSEGRPPVSPAGVPLYADMYAPTLAEFKTQGLLPQGFAESAPTGGTAWIRLAAPAACPGQACRVDALVYASMPLSDSQGRPDMMRMAVLVEAAAGYGGQATAGAQSRLRGKAFDFPNPYASGAQALPAGTPVLWAGMDMATAAQYVRRFDERDPQLKAGLTVAGAVTGRRLKADEYLQIAGQAVPGGACSPNGLVGRTPEGALLSCQAGTWAGFADSTTFYMVQTFGGACVSSNVITGSCSCPPRTRYVSLSGQASSNGYSFDRSIYACIP
ncbi:shufflon system plasmid conjugative transfer pilus tip adhesin PilV [Bordetella sp. FB-8]|uniref:shufflon system plasmid conjugative transfer pilus tip adhesin PilV n=1 Tax=Bordetella sp. FB-8 TaxID=1159870 RepID=UPI00035D22CE|nr:shufflon system plasmid conjugative transfer pilus tip adhesin PilV [Bordetella sp. FB-8]